MHLTPAELARLEAMIAAGQVRSEPEALSATDRLLDAMRLAAARRPAPAARPVPARDAAPAGADSGLDWTEPRALDELIAIRRALLRQGRGAQG